MTTWAPPRAPRRTVSSDSASRIRNASRSVGRGHPELLLQLGLGRQPAALAAARRATIWPRSWPAISSVVFGIRTGGRTASLSNRSGTQSRSKIVALAMPPPSHMVCRP